MAKWLRTAFWTLCRWAAVGFVLLGLVGALQISLGALEVTHFQVGNAGGRCVMDKGIFGCSGFPGAALVSYLTILPPAVFIGAPLVLIGTLSGAIFSELGKATIEILSFGLLACSWFVLGCIGVLRWMLSFTTLRRP